MSDRLQRLVMWILAVAVVGGTALALRYVSGYRPLTGLSFMGESGLPADIVLRFNKVTVVGRSENRKAWSLNAGKIQTDQTRSRIDFSGGVTATLMDSGQQRASVTAPQATYNMHDKVLVAAGQVTCRVYPRATIAGQVSGRDLVIGSDELIWTVGSHRVSCPGNVEAAAPGIDLKGTALAVDLVTSEKTLNNAVAEVPIQTDGGLTSGDSTSPIALKEYIP